MCEKISDEVIGYVANLELANDFAKTLYMTKAEIEKHAQEFSQSYQADKNKTWSIWAKNFDKMATKTVLKLLLKNWGVKSVEMQQALQSDFGIVENSTFTASTALKKIAAISDTPTPEISAKKKQ